MVQDDGPSDWTGRVEFDDERAVSDAGVMLSRRSRAGSASGRWRRVGRLRRAAGRATRAAR